MQLTEAVRPIMSPASRHRMMGLPVLDLALAAVLLVASVGAVLSGDVVEGPRGLTLAVAAVSATTLAVRGRWPLGAAIALTAAAVSQAIWGLHSPATLMALLITLVIAYSVGAECPEGLAGAGLVVVLGGGLLCEWLDGGHDYPFVTMEIGGAWLLGRAARGLRSRATYAEQHQQDLARIAVAEERTRIARELHDVVAHSLSVIAVQADAAEAALDREPARAAAPMKAIRSSARDALSDMRQLLHVLRADSPELPEREPARGIADLGRLVATAQESGLPVEARVRLPDELPAGIGLAVYRIAQEGLTNVRKHAGAVPTRLTILVEDDRLSIEVENAAGRTSVPDLSTGHGLLGIRERVRAAGGSLQAAPTASGGFRLFAVLPMDSAATRLGTGPGDPA